MITFVTSHGNIDIEINLEKAPISAKNFLKYCQDGFYDGTIFHRVIKDFMIQGGGLTVDMQEKPTRPAITNEANRGLKNVIGTIAMARTESPHSATGQFYINLADNDFLDHTATTNKGWGYAVFGKVTAGMDIVNTIAKSKTISKDGYDDVPYEAIVIQKVELS